jgi:hypothetical protein
MKFHISCKEAVDHINKKEEAKISFLQQVQLWNHLAICSLCKRFAAQNKMLTQLFKKTEAPKDIQFSTEEKSKLIHTLATSEE